MDCDSESTLLWEHRFDDLRQWKEAHGDCNVPKAEGKLGRWVVRQRELRKKSKLEPERKVKLDNLGFVWNTNEAAWEHKYALLVKYKEAHNHCCVPISDATLGMWVAKMRANRRRGKLTQHRIDKLNAINFVWNTAEADWMNKYNRLIDFRSANGHACVPFNEGELGWWVNTQRQNKRKGKLLAHREALLNKAAFVWAPQEFLAARRRRQAEARANAAHLLSSAAEYHYRVHQDPQYSQHSGRNYAELSPISPAHLYEENPPKRQSPSCYEHAEVGERHTAYLRSPTSLKPLKRIYPCYDENDLAGRYPCQSDPEMPSPTSIKRARMSPYYVNRSPPLPVAQYVEVPAHHVREAGLWGSQGPPVPRATASSPNIEPRTSTVGMPAMKVSNNSKSDGLSIASLLSPPQLHQTPSPVKSEAADLREQEALPTKDIPSLRSAGILSSICGIAQMSGKLKSCSQNANTGKRRKYVLPPIHSLRGFEITKAPQTHHVQ